MNIFAVSADPVVAAQMLCDEHVVKMPLESAQMMSTVWHQHHGRKKIPSPVYKVSHPHHPCTLWVGATTMNYRWLYQHAVALVAEHKTRYKREALHKSYAIIHALRDPPPGVPVGPLQPFALCMPDKYRNPLDPVESYRNFYLGEKMGFATWKFCEPPWWVSYSSTALV